MRVRITSVLPSKITSLLGVNKKAMTKRKKPQSTLADAPLNPISPQKHLDSGLDRALDLLAAQALDHAEQEALVDIALAEIDELPGGAFGVARHERTRAFLRSCLIRCGSPADFFGWAGARPFQADNGL
jgi:hypothetical protein